MLIKMKYLITYIILFLFTAGTAYGLYNNSALNSSGSLSAENSTEIVTACWEDDADAMVFGNAAENAALNGDHFHINMFCSGESVKEIRYLRMRLADVLQSEISNIVFKSVAIDLLYNIGDSHFNGLSERELGIIRSTDLSSQTDIPFKSADFSQKQLPRELLSVLTVTAALTGPGFSLCKYTSSHAYIKKYKFTAGIRISRENEIDHADFYRLFLYMRDNTGAAKNLLSHSCPCLTLDLYFSSLFLQHLKQKSTLNISPEFTLCSEAVYTKILPEKVLNFNCRCSQQFRLNRYLSSPEDFDEKW